MKFVKVQTKKHKKSDSKTNEKIEYERSKTKKIQTEPRKQKRNETFLFCKTNNVCRNFINFSLKCRSEVMYLCQLFMDKDALFPSIAELGRICLVQFDRPSLNSRYNGHIHLCFLMEKTLAPFLKLIEEHQIKTDQKEDDIIEPIIPNSPAELDQINLKLTQISEEYHRIIQHLQPLEDNYRELDDYSTTLENLMNFIDDNIETDISFIFDQKNYTFQTLDLFIGVIRKDKVIEFERSLWRFCLQAHYFKRFSNEQGRNVSTTSFCIFFIGEELKSKIKKICKGYGTSLFFCPRDRTDQRLLLNEIENKKTELRRIIIGTHQRKLLILVKNANRFLEWQTKIKIMKSIFIVCNSLRLDVTRNVYVAELWLAKRDIQTIQIALNTAILRAGYTVLPMLIRIKTDRQPPTYYKRNKFTQGFQDIIDAYGLATYREISPTPFTIITFPFLFSVMFGDIGHGLILLVAAIYMILIENRYKKKKILNEIFRMIFSGRYVLLMLGLFSIYSGALYNEVFSVPFNIKSHWYINQTEYKSELSKINHEVVRLDPNVSYSGTPTAFGIDMIWRKASNKIIASNSFKMKISIIFGLLQMSFGLVLKAMNASYFKNRLSILLEVVPMALFLLCLFGYLVFLIIIKWFLYSAKNPVPRDASCAPSILVTFIDMVMFKSSNKLPEECFKEIYPNEKLFEKILVCVALLSVPVLLLGKPIHMCLRKRSKKSETSEELNRRQKKPTIRLATDRRSVRPTHPLMGRHSTISSLRSMITHETNLSNLTYKPEDLQEEPEEMGEIMIFQGIHTIDSVIGSVSHTASYLRLWALSLAHSQMSEVVWEMIFRRALILQHSGYRIVNVITIVIFFAIWAVLSVVILVTMEGLSTFLHTTRLHWVEFQSKFYFGNGCEFYPFCFKNILNN